MLQICAPLPTFLASCARSQSVAWCIGTPAYDERRYCHWRAVHAAHVPAENPQPGRSLAHFLQCGWRDVGL